MVCTNIASTCVVSYTPLQRIQDWQFFISTKCKREVERVGETGRKYTDGQVDKQIDRKWQRPRERVGSERSGVSSFISLEKIITSFGL